MLLKTVVETEYTHKKTALKKATETSMSMTFSAA